VINAAVSGGSGTNAKAILANRLQAGTPPDSYQRHAGLELADDIKAKKLEDLTSLYESKGWKTKLPKGLLDAITIDGKIYSVPVNIHRANLLWFLPKTLQSLGIGAPPATWKEFLTQAAAITKKHKTPLAIGPGWTQKHLLETVYSESSGPSSTRPCGSSRTSGSHPRSLPHSTKPSRRCWHLPTSSHRPLIGSPPRIECSTERLSTLSWVTGSTPTGGARRSSSSRPTTMWSRPGSSGVYDFLSDSFTLPVGAKHREAALKWLDECGSVTGQDLFNPQKGSVPARTDADASKYQGYLATALAAWQNPKTVIVGSLTHGVVANNAVGFRD
jgi:glucose/mannose transport system substrate-binding protein